LDYSILIFTRLSDKPVRGPIHVVRQGSATIDRAGTGCREESRQVQQDDSNEKDNRFGWVRLVHSTVTDKGTNKQKTSRNREDEGGFFKTPNVFITSAIRRIVLWKAERAG